MAARMGLGGPHQLQHFVASPAWEDAPLWSVLAQQADKPVGGPQAWLVIDLTSVKALRRLSEGPRFLQRTAALSLSGCAISLP